MLVTGKHIVLTLPTAPCEVLVSSKNVSPHSAGGGGFGMTPWCEDLVCSWRRLLADRHSLPFPWTLSLHRQWCPSASHHPLTFLFLLALAFPLPTGGPRFFFAIFPQFSTIFRNCFLFVHLAWLLVPCVSPVQRCCSLKLREVWLRHRNFPAIFRNFSQLPFTLPDRIPPPLHLMRFWSSNRKAPGAATGASHVVCCVCNAVRCDATVPHNRRSAARGDHPEAVQLRLPGAVLPEGPPASVQSVAVCADRVSGGRVRVGADPRMVAGDSHHVWRDRCVCECEGGCM